MKFECGDLVRYINDLGVVIGNDHGIYGDRYKIYWFKIRKIGWYWHWYLVKK